MTASSGRDASVNCPANLRLSHFFTSLPLLAGGIVAALLPVLSEFFLSLFNVLPTLLLLLGGSFCLAYGISARCFCCWRCMSATFCWISRSITSQAMARDAVMRRWSFT